MAESILNQITLSSQELNALNQIIHLSFDAFEKAGYPLYYDCFLMNIFQLIQLGSAALTSATPKISLQPFSEALDVLSGFIREIGTIQYYKKTKLV